MLNPGLGKQGFNLGRLHPRNSSIRHQYVNVALTCGYELANFLDLVLDV